MNRYIDPLNSTAEQMAELARKLSEQKAQPLKPSEKQLIRLAVLPRVRETLELALIEFTIGKEMHPDEGPLCEFLAMAYDLKE